MLQCQTENCQNQANWYVRQKEDLVEPDETKIIKICNKCLEFQVMKNNVQRVHPIQYEIEAEA